MTTTPKYTGKNCTTCGRFKPLNLFYNSKTYRDGKSYRCKKCDTQARRNYELKYGDRLKPARRNNRMKHIYGITSEEYDIMHDQQGGVCKICGEKGFKMNKGHRNGLVLDHCHSTGKLRGFLCPNCNRGLGLFKDDVVRMKEAIRYLEEYK